MDPKGIQYRIFQLSIIFFRLDIRKAKEEEALAKKEAELEAAAAKKKAEEEAAAAEAEEAKRKE